MKKTIQLFFGALLFFGSLHFATAQENQLSFDYDAAGNQIKRYFTVEPTETRALENKNILTFQTEEEYELGKKFKVYPNQTTGPITVSWESDVNASIQSVDATPSGGGTRIELNYQKLGSDQIQFDLSNKREGYYFIRFILSDGRIITKKIIKK